MRRCWMDEQVMVIQHNPPHAGTTYAAALKLRLAKEDAALAFAKAGQRLDAIGSHFGVSRSRAGQLVNNAFARRKKMSGVVIPANPRDILLEHLPNTTERLRNCLRAEGLLTLGDAADCSDQQLLRIPNFGKTTLRELKEVLRHYGVPASSSSSPVRVYENDVFREATQVDVDRLFASIHRMYRDIVSLQAALRDHDIPLPLGIKERE